MRARTHLHLYPLTRTHRYTLLKADSRDINARPARTRACEIRKNFPGLCTRRQGTRTKHLFVSLSLAPAATTIDSLHTYRTTRLLQRFNRAWESCKVSRRGRVAHREAR